jgi:large subunit ribosomal protein L3
MLTRLLGKKIGMTQLFNDDRVVVPVSVINIGDWYVTQIKTKEKDGYFALQLSLIKDKYKETGFSLELLKQKKNIFSYVREILIEQGCEKDFSQGQKISFDDFGIKEKDLVSVTGKSRGLGFQGVVKRWNFKGGPASHGSTFHRKPGAIGNMTREGNVVKGKKMPGQCGNKQITTKGLTVVGIDKEKNCIFVKGSVPGKKDSLLLIRKQG